MYFNNTIF